MSSNAAKLALGLLVLAVAPLATAYPLPPAGYTCIGGYNGQAYTNICYSLDATPETDEWTTRNDTCVYIIGNLPGCVSYLTPVQGAILEDVPAVWAQTTLWCATGGDNSLLCNTVDLP